MIGYLFVLPRVARSVKEYGACSVNIDGKRFDLHKAYDKQVQSFTDTDTGYTYYFKLCDALDQADLPFGSAAVMKGANVMRRKENSQVWEYTNYLSEFDWTIREMTVNYNADGQPFQSEGLWHIVDFDVIIGCDASSTTAPPPFTKSIIHYGNRTQINILVNSQVGCPTTVQAPTPTPLFYPVCEFVSRMDNSSTAGIDAQLDEIDGGPFGVRAPVLYNGKQMALHLKPCGRMKCPPPYNCTEGIDYSNAWLCPLVPDSDLCESFGVAKSDVNPASVAAGGELNGFELDFYEPTRNYHTKVRVKQAEESYPDGYMRIEENIFLDATSLTVSAYSHEADIVSIPIPPSPLGKCNADIEGPSVDLKMSLKGLNPESISGYFKWNVNVSGIKGQNQFDLYYLPCGGIKCPSGHDCEGTEDATVYLCTDDRDCKAYGLFENNINFTLVNPFDFTKGLRTNYYGQNTKRAIVTYLCDQELEESELRFDETSPRLDGTIFKFTAYAKQACAINKGPTPTPRPQWFIPTPPPYPKPTPTPMKSPNPHNIMYNSTHYVSFNLDKFNRTHFKKNMTMTNHIDSADVYFEFSAWEKIPCPNTEGACYAQYQQEANSYICYYTSRTQKNCFPYADISYDQVISNPTHSLSNIVTLTYQNNLDTDLRFKIYCDDSLDYNTLFINDGQTLILDVATDHVVTLTASSHNACPLPFTDPKLPRTPNPTPMPAPVDPSKLYFRSEPINNKYIELDLTNIPTHREKIVLGTPGDYEKAEILYDPDTPRECGASQRECLGGGETNIWKCVDYKGSQKCYGIGDARQSINYHVSDDLMDGIAVTYGGGYSGYRTTVLYLCNVSVPWPKIDFDDIGYESNMKVVTLYAHTSYVCPKPYTPPTSGPTKAPTTAPTIQPVTYTPAPTSAPEPYHPDSGKVTGGAIFMMVVFFPILLYVGLGTIINGFVTGNFELPFQKFWSEFYQNFITGFKFVFTCGHPGWCGGQGGYDQI